MSSALDAWENFFKRCELPSSVRRKYAQRFVKERIQPYMLKDLSKEELRELGIDALGDQLSILRYVKSSDGVLHEFKHIGKSRDLSDERDDYMDTELQLQSVSRAEDFGSRTIKMRGGQHYPIHAKGLKNDKHGVRFSNIDTTRRIADQSRVIRKKPVMIHDISSSSPIRPSIGSMRSDAISLKTIIVDSPSPKRSVGSRFNRQAVSPAVANRRPSPNFQIRLNRNYEGIQGGFEAVDDYDEDYYDEEEFAGSSQLVGPSNQLQRHQRAPAIGTSAVRRVLANTSSRAQTRPISSRIGAKSNVIGGAPGRRVTLRANNIVGGREKPSIQSRVQRNLGKLIPVGQGGDSNGILNRISIVKR